MKDLLVYRDGLLEGREIPFLHRMILVQLRLSSLPDGRGNGYGDGGGNGYGDSGGNGIGYGDGNGNGGGP